MRWKCNPGIDLHNHWQTLVCIQIFRNHKSIILRWKNHPSYFTNWLWSFLASLKKAWVCLMFFLLVVLQQREMERYPIFFPGLWEKPSSSSQSLLCLGEHNPVRFHQPTNQATISTKHTTQTLQWRTQIHREGTKNIRVLADRGWKPGWTAGKRRAWNFLFQFQAWIFFVFSF